MKPNMKIKKAILTTFAVFAVSFVALAQDLQPREGFTVHTVKWFEDLPNISAKYGVPEDIILKVNRLENSKLNTRQQIYIPTSEKYWPKETAQPTPSEPIKKEEHVPVIPEIKESAAVKEESAPISEDKVLPVEDQQIFNTPEPKSEITFALTLPFESGSESERGNCLDFYSGILLASKKLAEEGISINLNVHDISDTDNISQENNDFIIGPIKSDDLSNLLWKVGWIPVVSPLDQKAEALATSHQNFVQAPSGTAAQYEEAVNWACSTSSDKKDNFIIITSSSDTLSLRLARQPLEKAGKTYGICKCSVQGEVSGWNRYFNPDARNIVIIAATGEAILNNALRNMVIESTKGEIVTFAGSKIRSYSTIPVENLHLANTHVLCPYYVDYSDSATHSFVRTYRALYNSDPSQYAFQGYDLAYFMAKSYSDLGRSWSNLADTLPRMDMLQTSFQMQRTDSGAMQNHGMRRLEYTRDYKIELVK